jgi:hypothetical protein
MTAKVSFRSSLPQRDHARPRAGVIPTNEALDARLTELVVPALATLVADFRFRGYRDRLLGLPVMVALLLAMIWRHVEGLATLVTVLETEGFLWVPPFRVSPQAVSQRLQSLPADFFATLFHQLMPVLHARADARTRPLTPSLAQARRHFSAVLAADGTTLEALFRKLGPLRGRTKTILAGRVLALLDVSSKQPRTLFYEANPTGTDHVFLGQLLAALTPGALVLLDAGFYDFRFFAALTARGVAFICRGKFPLAGTVVTTFREEPTVHDRLLRIGANSRPRAIQIIRVVDITVAGKARRYLTNVVDPTILSAEQVADLYAQRWRIEEAFLLVKRLLGLSYLVTGGENGIQLQIWTTWVLYAVLLDLCDAIAEELALPLARISTEMVYRGIPLFCSAFQKGLATDIVPFLASLTRFGIVKRVRIRHPPLAAP